MSKRRHAILLFLTVLAAGLAVFGRHNAFSFYYHPDEPGKVAQIIRHKRNFHHPMMMLSTVNIARYVVLRGDAQKDPQKVVMVGRWATAAASALAAAALAVLAFRTFGAAAGWAFGLLAVTNPLLFELAHYFKEDPWMMAGIACFCLALNAFSETPTRRCLHLLAAAAAMAAAGKYIAFLFLPVALWLVWKRTAPGERKARLLPFLATFAGVWLLFNLPFFRSPSLLFASLHEESTKLAGLTDGVSRNVPHGFYLIVQRMYGGWTLPVISLLWLGAAIWTPRKITAAEWLLAATAVSQFVLYSFVPKTASRYHLPISLAFGFLAVAGLARVLAGVRERVWLWRGGLAAGAALVGVAVFFQVRSLQAIDAGLTADDRARLIEWVRANVPADAVLAQDQAVYLPDPARIERSNSPLLPQRIVGGKKESADLGSIADLRAQGVTHVAICGRTYLRYLDENKTDKNGSNQTPERVFYDTLLKKGRIVWSSEFGQVTYLQPGLKLVDITGL